MEPVICNSRGSHAECDNCGASQLHYSEACEPCPLIHDAECKPVNLPAFFKANSNEIIKVININDFVKVLNRENFSFISTGHNHIIVSDAFKDFTTETTEGEFNSEFEKAVERINLSRHSH